MKKYILIASILLANNAFAQLIIGDLKIETAGANNRINITNIGDKPIENITINNLPLSKNERTLKPNEKQTFIFRSWNQTAEEKKEQDALLDLLDTKLIN